MGKRGPKPKPTALRIHEGSRIPTATLARIEVTSTSDVKCPTAPSWLGSEGRKEWRKTAPKLHAAGLLTKLDVTLFAVYCDAFDDFHEALKHVAKTGVVVTGYRGGMVKNPMLSVKNAATSLIVKIGSMFGLSPSSRVGINAPVMDLGFDDLESFKRGPS